MSRVGSLIFAVLVILALLIAFDPQARAKAQAVVRDLNLKQWDKVVVTVPTVSIPVTGETPEPTSTPVATPAVSNDADNHDSSNEPFITVNWDALADSLRKIWANLNARLNTDLKNSK